MPNQLHYQGDRTTDLLAQVEAGHLWGPDLCGNARWSWFDVCWAMKTGLYAVVSEYVQTPMPQGAWYELAEAEYDESTDVTTAQFRPHVDPRTRIRYHSGDDTQLDEQPTLSGRDHVAAR